MHQLMLDSPRRSETCQAPAEPILLMQEEAGKQQARGKAEEMETGLVKW